MRMLSMYGYFPLRLRCTNPASVQEGFLQVSAPALACGWPSRSRSCKVFFFLCLLLSFMTKGCLLESSFTVASFESFMFIYFCSLMTQELVRDTCSGCSPSLALFYATTHDPALRGAGGAHGVLSYGALVRTGYGVVLRWLLASWHTPVCTDRGWYTEYSEAISGATKCHGISVRRQLVRGDKFCGVFTDFVHIMHN